MSARMVLEWVVVGVDFFTMFFQRRRGDIKTEFAFFEGGGAMGAEKKIVQKRCFL